jgi:hypothetical protein
MTIKENKMKKIKIKSLITLATLSLVFSNAAEFTSSPQDGSISFKAIGKPAFLKIDGKGAGPAGKVTAQGKKLSGEFSIDLNTLSTGIDLRDEHMKEKYLKTKTQPIAVLKIENLDISNDLSSATEIKNEKLKALLTLNNTTKEISGLWNSKQDANGNNIQAEFAIKLSDFAIEIPEYAGITVADEVKIAVSTKLLPLKQSGIAR